MSEIWATFTKASFLAGVLAWWAERCYQRMQQLPHTIPADPLPSLSVIVPARNESANLRRLLPNLAGLNYPGRFEILVVDDNSSDATAEVAQQFGVRLLKLADPPAGWLGKPHACHRGAEVANGDWLLFTDADTLHAVDGPAAAVAYATRRHLDGLSLFPEPRADSWIVKLALIVAFAGLFAGTGRREHVFNGQYILLRRDVYERIGGFRSVASEPLEDVALGRQLRALGFQAPTFCGERVASVRMYQDTRSLWNGLTRLTAGSLRRSSAGSWITALSIGSTVSVLLAITTSLTGQLTGRGPVIAWTMAAVGYSSWARRFGALWLAILVPFGAVFVMLAAIWGLILHALGRGYRWKHRSVPTGRRMRSQR